MSSLSSSSSSSSFGKVAVMFQSTFQDLEIRSEVHDVLQGMLWDVEMTAHLQDQLQQEEEQAQWAELLKHQKHKVDQVKIKSSTSQHTYQQWADQLVKELWLFSQDYGRLLETQHNTTKKLQRELEQTQEELATALAALKRRDTSRPTTTTTTPATTTQAQPPPPAATVTLSVPSQDEVSPAVPAPTMTTTQVLTTASSFDSKEASTITTAAPATITKAVETTEATKIAAPATTAAVVTLMSSSEEEAEDKEAEDKETGDGDGTSTVSSSTVVTPIPIPNAKTATTTTTTTSSPTLVSLEIEFLMHIFGFLDALDILNTAQVNIAMYSKVDSLFGLGASNNSRNEASEGETATTATTAAAATIASAAAASTKPNAVPTTAIVPSAAAAPPAATVVAATPTKASSSLLSGSETASSLILGGGKGLFSLLSSSASSSAAAAASAAASKSHKPSGSSSSFPLGILSSSSSSTAAAQPQSLQQLHQQQQDRQQQQQQQQQQPWTRSMADSLSKKLTDAEMSAIISMTVKLRQRNQDVEQLKVERDELQGKIQGMEAIRQFLLDKIRQVELTLTKTRDDTVKVTQQSASDQEVIAFLDSRVQELEREVQNLTKSKQQLQDDSTRAQSLLSQKVSVLSDMLQFERERYRDHDREAKTTKKVLVKEVKQCRAQIVALQAQRDGCMEENDKLRRALLSSNTTANSNKPNTFEAARLS